MGLDIGFTLYEKKPFDEEGKLVRAPIDIDDNWLCGWGKPNESWGSLFGFGEQYDVPVFQKELADKEFKLEEFSEKYRLVDFDEFAAYVHEACTDEYHEADAEKDRLHSNRAECQKTIKELRELQKGCTEENEYAFNRWNDEISANKERIERIDALLSENDFGDERQAKSVNKLLESMEKYLKENKYYVIPYFSC